MKNDMTCDNFKSNNKQEIDTIKDMMPGFVFKCKGLLYPLLKYEDGTIHRVNNGELADLPEDLLVTKIVCNSYGTTGAEIMCQDCIEKSNIIMRWKTLEEELPDYEREIFAKIQEQADNNSNPKYIECYVLTREKNWCEHESDSYVEALGERYMRFEPSEIIGWVYVDDLQKMLDMSTTKND